MIPVRPGRIRRKADYAALPRNAQKYCEAIGTLTGTKVTIVSVGARRDQTIFLN